MDIPEDAPRGDVPRAEAEAWPAFCEPKKIKLVHHQLVLLLHAYKCERRVPPPDAEKPPCKVKHCETMRTAINHMIHCPESGNGCTTPHCTSSKLIINHWKDCNKTDCPICSSVRPPWQRTMPSAQRRHLVDLLMEAINTSTNGMILGQVVQDKLAYAEKLEREIYRKSVTRAQYYHLLSEKIWEIEMDIGASRRKEQIAVLDALENLLNSINVEPFV